MKLESQVDAQTKTLLYSKEFATMGHISSMLLCGDDRVSVVVIPYPHLFYSKMKLKKIFHWLMTLILMSVFLVLSSISLNSLLSWKVGTRLKVENGPKHPDMTFCSFAYNRKYDKLITQINPNNSSSNNR